ncbi:MAG: hypothetical protein WAN93_13860, partial [Solirubrobacteraceae bacterium]
MRVRLALAGSMALCVVLSVLVASWGATAQAAVTHRYLSQITEIPASSGASVPGALAKMESMTFDSGHLWIAEKFGGGSRVDEFDGSTGAFLSQPVHVEPPIAFGEGGVAVGHATGAGELYVGETVGGEPAVGVFNEAGAPQATWTGADTPGGSFGSFLADVAVDNSTSLSDSAAGDVYVAASSQGAIDVFHPETGGKEKYVTQLTGISPGESFGFPFKMVVNEANGDLIVLDVSASTLDVFEPTVLGEYAFVRKITGTPSGSLKEIYNLAVDSGTGEIYVTEGFKPPVIDQFSATGAYLGRITGVGSPGGNLSDVFSLAADPVSDDVFIADNRNSGGEKSQPAVVDVFGPDVVIPDVTTVPVSNQKPMSVSLNGTVNPDEAGAATCQFVWGTSASFGQVTPCSEAVSEGGSPVAVHAVLSGLQPDRTYHYRLQASNANGTNPGEPFEDREFTTPGPGISGESVSNIASTSATLGITVNPHNAPTTYYFQYGTSNAYSSSAPAPPGAALGSGEGRIEVGQHLQGLLADTTYHYRAIVISEPSPGEFEEFDGEDHVFTTQAAHSKSGLPDDRAWEMVSPPNKQGASLRAIGGGGQGGGQLIQAAADGSALAYGATGPTEESPPGNRAPEAVQIFSQRSPGGWLTKVIATPHNVVHSELAAGHESEYKVFSADLSLGVVGPQGFTALSSEATEGTVYLRHDTTCDVSPTGCYQPLVTATNVAPNVKFGGSAIKFIDATPDLSHVIIESTVALTANGSAGLYEWADGNLTYVADMKLGNPNGGDQTVRHAVSDDGSRVIGNSAGGGMIMRDIPEESTIRLDSVEPGAVGGREEPVFQTASSDGSRVFFTDASQLTTDSRASSGESVVEDKSDLYEFNVATDKLSDLSVPLNSGEHADVQGSVLGASEDGSYIYFVANGVLATGATPGNCSSISGQSEGVTCNLYVSHDGITTFIATLSGEDSNSFALRLMELTARVSPDGRWLAFMSDRDLTGYDNRDAFSGKPDEEVFLYRADAEVGSKSLVCASCNPTGARPVGALDHNASGANGEPSELVDASELWGGHWLAGLIPGWT